MAKRKSTAREIPDAMRDAVERTIQATVGSAQITRERAQEAVDEVVRGAEASAGAVRERVREAERGAESVRERVLEAIGDARPATQEDLRDLRDELRAIGDRLEAIERSISGQSS